MPAGVRFFVQVGVVRPPADPDAFAEAATVPAEFQVEPLDALTAGRERGAPDPAIRARRQPRCSAIHHELVDVPANAAGLRAPAPHSPDWVLRCDPALSTHPGLSG
jgi:hypothetical protein